MATLQITPEPSSAYLDLAWEVFFSSRGRGVSLEVHFPWIRVPPPATWFVELREGKTLLGGLVVKDCTERMLVKDVQVAAIALVCVAPGHRGRGHGKFLMEAAMAKARVEGVDALTLWTTTPMIYSSLGFVTRDPTCFGWVDNPAGTEPGSQIPGLSDVPTEGLPLPPFANTIHRLEFEGGHCVILMDPLGPVLATYQGDYRVVARNLGGVMPARWRMNSFRGDPLPGGLAEMGHKMDFRPSNLQMWGALQGGRTPDWLASHSQFSVLDRV